MESKAFVSFTTEDTLHKSDMSNYLTRHRSANIANRSIGGIESQVWMKVCTTSTVRSPGTQVKRDHNERNDWQKTSRSGQCTGSEDVQSPDYSNDNGSKEMQDADEEDVH